MKIDEYRAQAKLNSSKSANDFNVGDFIITATGCGKDTNFTDFIDARENWNMGSNDRLCKVVDIIDVSEDEDFLNGWLNKEAPAHKGGSESHDIDERKDQYSLTKDDYATFFDLITIFRKPSGKWIGVDCQGYDYWRYVHLPVNYEELFVDEWTAAVKALAEREADRIAEKIKDLAQHAEDLNAREEELRNKYSGLVLNPTNSRIVGNNVRKFLAIEFPGVKFKVRVRSSYYDGRYDVSVEADGIPNDKRAEIRKICKIWTDTLPTGRMVDFNDYQGECESRISPMAIFGNIHGQFSFLFR